ncbi:MAG: succinate--CoA ligase subunit beta, partial [Bdellovibrionales bacterium]|nr:succinate--CoA ligase subunit beta [Bdellovibrionales bacterium]
MNIHEYQAKEVLRNFGTVTLKGGTADTVEEAVDVAKKLGGS